MQGVDDQNVESAEPCDSRRYSVFPARGSALSASIVITGTPRRSAREISAALSGDLE